MIKIYDFLADLFQPILAIKYGDKMLHFVAFGLLGLLAFTPLGQEWFPRTSVWNAAMFSAFFGIIWEMFWRLFGKPFGLLDIVADWFGGLFFGILFYLFIGGIPFYVPLGG